MEINGYELVNEEKLNRAIEGSPTAGGGLIGGVGHDDKDLILATYDRLGGLVLKGGRKVKTGSFWDFKRGIQIAEPVPVLLIRVGDELVEVPEGEQMPIEVKAQDILTAAKKEKAAAKKAEKDAAKEAAVKKNKGIVEISE